MQSRRKKRGARLYRHIKLLQMLDKYKICHPERSLSQLHRERPSRRTCGSALALGATLVTNNLRHYERIQAPLLLENWTL
jgi:hypothetical protein